MAAWYIRPSGDNRELRELVLMSLYPSSSLFLCCPCTYVDFPLYFSLKKKKDQIFVLLRKLAHASAGGGGDADDPGGALQAHDVSPERARHL